MAQKTDEMNMQETVTVRVRPQAKTTKLAGTLADGSLKIDLVAPAEDGKANTELVRFFAEMYGIRRTQVTILSGQTSRRKVVRIQR